MLKLRSFNEKVENMECNKKDIEQEMKHEQNVGRRWTPTDSTETHSQGKLNSRIVSDY